MTEEHFGFPTNFSLKGSLETQNGSSVIAVK